MTMIKTNESGRSMMEMLGVLAIIGVLSVGGIAGYSKAMNKFKTNKVADNVSMLVANIKTMYAQQSSFNGLTKSSAVSMGLVPDELVTTYPSGNDDNAVLNNSFNGTVLINASNSVGATAAANTDDALSFNIVFNGLSKEACITLATNDWGSGYSSGLIGMQVKNAEQAVTDDTNVKMGCKGTTAANATTPQVACPGGENTALPMPVAQAAAACKCDNGNTCSILWKYY